MCIVYYILRDIAELTQHANHLENELSQFGEENEALREKLGLGVDANVDVSAVRARRVTELERLRRESRMLENQVCVWGCLCWRTVCNMYVGLSVLENHVWRIMCVICRAVCVGREGGGGGGEWGRRKIPLQVSYHIITCMYIVCRTLMFSYMRGLSLPM